MSREREVVARLAPFGTTVFAEMSRLAVEHGAVNLSQGFPDFDGPEWVKEAAARAMAEGHNQYAPTGGVPVLTSALADRFESTTGIEVDPGSEVTVTDGCTEALAATHLGLIDQGDEVILFEPFYDSYRACVALAGGVARFVTLRAPDGEGPFTFDEGELRAAFGPRTRAIVVNTPHNPTGKVFTREELELIARLCVEHDVIAITDEMYEELVFDGAEAHVSLASLPGMRERTVTLSSLGKTFSFTGWKIGWAIAPPALTAGVRAAHQFLTYAVATPLQHGAAAAIREGAGYVAELRAHYQEARDYLCGVLSRAGFDVYVPDGTYFVMAGHERVSRRLGIEGDVALCRHLTAEVGVAAIPPSFFYSEASRGAHLVRFAFCKRMETLERAAAKLEAL